MQYSWLALKILWLIIKFFWLLALALAGAPFMFGYLFFCDHPAETLSSCYGKATLCSFIIIVGLWKLPTWLLEKWFQHRHQSKHAQKSTRKTPKAEQNK